MFLLRDLVSPRTWLAMISHLAGWLGVWPQRGVRYSATSLPAGDDALPTLVAFLRELAKRTA